ncbi:MAG: glycine cleavage system protein H, partial [Anaerolineae bacterium]|nr:glycine cleavage system protein H [Anaerolineae bacterium]
MSGEEYLQATVGKFVFVVKKGYLYDEQGVWLTVRDGQARVGVTDFLQQKSGDVAFVNVPETGTELTRGKELGSIETIKADVRINSPVSGVICERNEELDVTPELVNQDPYGDGWLVVIETTDYESDRQGLLTPEG